MKVKYFDSESISVDDLSDGTLKRDSTKLHYQQEANVKPPGHVAQFIFDENNNDYQICNAFFRFKMIKSKDGNV